MKTKTPQRQIALNGIMIHTIAHFMIWIIQKLHAYTIITTIGYAILPMTHPILIGTAVIHHGTINTNKYTDLGDYAMWILVLLGLWFVIIFVRNLKEEKELDKWVHEHQHDRRIERYKHDTDEEPDKKEHSIYSTDITDICCDPMNVYYQNIHNQD